MRWVPGVALAIALTCGCAATADDRRSGNTVTFNLEAEPRNAGQVGSGFMMAQGDKTLLVLKITGVPPWVVRPVQVYTFVYAGSCAQHGATPAYALNEIVQAGLFSNTSFTGPFTLEKTVPVPMDTLRSGNYAVVLRTSPADGNVDIFCGEMK
jgi:hypothetical protein